MRPVPVVVGSHPGSPWLDDCLRSIPIQRQTLVHRDGGFELAALRFACKHFSRFLYLQDSTVVRHPLFWDEIDAAGSCWLFGWPGMYLGVYDRESLEPVLADAPEMVTKELSIEWEHRIRHALPYPILWPDVTDATGHVEHKHGRLNLVLQNRFLTKWKGTWA